MKRGVGRGAQITVFIMVGLLLLVVTSLVLFLTFNVPQRDALPLVPAEVRPVYDVINDCAKQLGQDAIRRLGAQGGYLDFPPEIMHNPTAYLAMDEDAALKVPLWYYDGEDRTPTIGFMERQIGEEIIAGMPACIDGFASLRDQFAIEPKGNMTVNVTLAKENVVVRMNYPLQWVSAGKQVDYSDFNTFLDVKLLRMWELANATLVAENRDLLLENATIDLMAIDPGVPMDALTFDCTPKRWTLGEVKTEVQGVLRTNLPTIRIKNTNYPAFNEPERVYENLKRYGMADVNAGRMPKDIPDDSYEYLHLFWDTGVSAKDLRAAFSYQPRWGMALTGNPNDNGVLESRVSRGGAGYLNFMCINTYHITYDVVYPVLFTVRDDKAFTGTGATFQMAFPVLIKTNSPNRQTFGIRSFRGFNIGTAFCDELGDEQVDLRAEGVMPGDTIGSELDDVQFTLRCVGRECPLGSSTADEGAYRLRTQLPVACQRPTIVASKSGFLTATSQLEGDKLTLQLKELRDVKIKVLKHPYELSSGIWGEPLQLGSVENVSIRISLKDGSLDQFVLYPANDTIQLLDGEGTYDVNLLLSQFGGLTGGFVQEALPIDSTSGTMTFHVLEGRPVGFTDDYQSKLTTYLYGTDYQARLAPEAWP
jgi:hypothetical protein